MQQQWQQQWKRRHTCRLRLLSCKQLLAWQLHQCHHPQLLGCRRSRLALLLLPLVHLLGLQAAMQLDSTISIIRSRRASLRSRPCSTCSSCSP
jgi:hypothetical protein